MSPPEGDLFFRSLVDGYTQAGNPRFLRRDWLADEVAERLAEPDCRFVLLTAEPGAGKSTFMAQLAHDHPGWPVYFIRRDQRAPLGDVGARSFLLRIGYQLAARYPKAFDQKSLQLAVHQRIGALEAGSQVVAAEVKRIIASPFYRKVIKIRQKVGKSAGRVVGLSVDELFVDPQLFDLSQLANMAIIDPACALLKLYPHEQIVILVDALDEIRYQPVEANILTWLTNCPELPPNVRFVLSSRPPDALLRAFAEKQKLLLQTLTIRPEDGKVQGDVLAYLDRLVKRPEVAAELAKTGPGTAGFLVQAAEKANGNLGYLDMIERGIDFALERKDLSTIQALLALRELPSDLEELYAFFLHQIQGEVEGKGLAVQVKVPGSARPLFLPAWPGVYRPLLSVLAVALEPLTPSQIHDLGGIAADSSFMADALGRLVQFLDLENGRYRFYHATLAEFLTDVETSQSPAAADLYVNAVEWNRLVADFYWQNHSPGWSTCDAYGLNSLAAHLHGGEQFDRLHELIGQKWMAARFQGDGFRYAGFLADISLALKGVKAGGKPAGGAENGLTDWAELARLGLIQTSLTSLGYDFPPQVLSQAVALRLWSPRRALDLASRLPAKAQRRLAYQLLLETGQLDGQEASDARAGMKAAGIGGDDEPGEPAGSMLDLRSIPAPEHPCTPGLRAVLERILRLGPDRLKTQARLEAQKLKFPLLREKRRKIEPPGDWESMLEALVSAFSPGAARIERGIAQSELLEQHLGVRIQFVAFNPAVEYHPLLALALTWCWDSTLAGEFGSTALELAAEMPEPLRIAALETLMQGLPEAALPRMLQEVLDLQDGESRQRLLGLLAPLLSPDLLQKTLTTLREVHRDEPARLRVLLALLPGLRGELHQQAAELAPGLGGILYQQAAELALELARTLPGADQSGRRGPRAEAFLELVPLLPETLREGAIQETEKATGAIPFQENSTRVSKAQAIAAAAMLHTGERRAELVKVALEMAYYPEEMAFRAPALAVLYREMDRDQLANKLEGIWLSHEDEALSEQVKGKWNASDPPDYGMVARYLLRGIARTPLTPGVTLWAFLGLAPDLAGAGIEDAMAILPKLFLPEESRARALVAIAPRMDPQQARTALEMARNLSAFRHQAAVIGAAAARLPEPEQASLLARGLDAALAMSDPADQAAALGGLAAGRPEWVRQNSAGLCAAAVRLLQPESILSRAAYLQRLADLLPVWSVLSSHDAPSALAQRLIEVCWRWQWL